MTSGFDENNSCKTILEVLASLLPPPLRSRKALEPFPARCPSHTEPQNLTGVSEFLLLVLSEDPKLQPVLAGLSLSMYLVTVLGNLLIILAVSSDSHLHTPMYFFFSNLSLADIGFTSATVPKVIVDMQSRSRVISCAGCLTQVSFFVLFACIEDMLLTVMAYDRFVAICHPLHYPVIMNPHLCVSLVLVSFFLGIFIYLDSTMLGFLPTSRILFSYSKIASSILRIPSSDGKYKAFSTCGSHLAVVCLFYRTILECYWGLVSQRGLPHTRGPSISISNGGSYLAALLTSISAWRFPSSSPRKGAVASMLYTVVTPMLNPFIYSLRNSDIKSVLQWLHNRTV
ncbi:PREDICTED: olfactory receptor 7E24-like [Cercocebus atys]|uniref:olfactory receptor 7E24-like n=1 Tax=Cercocebus atys TaxID=9531 RepID=UPI0005F4342E|nr:PREDICTED: olfactory receptor 7E24-like [Cercocebus atys]